jgi:hypothetical protein
LRQVLIARRENAVGDRGGTQMLDAAHGAELVEDLVGDRA